MSYDIREVIVATTLEQVNCGNLSIGAASIKLKRSTRTIYRKLKRYREGGIEQVVHQNRGKPSTKKIPESTWGIIRAVLDGHLAGFGPTHLAEKLQKHPYNLTISSESLRIWMHRNNYPIRKRRPPSAYRSKRPRRLYYGELVQLDGSYHDWFQGRGPWCTLIALIDDATSTIMTLLFVERETTWSVMESLRLFIERHGIPGALYTDQHTIYRIPSAQNREAGHKTHLQIAAEKLGIDIIHAHSPQAKGRVERLFRFCQDRLVNELSCRHISTIEAANKCLAKLMPELNAIYAKKPALPGNVCRPSSDYNLSEIFTKNETRQLQNDWTLTYGKRCLQLIKDQPIRIFPKDRVTVREYPDGAIKLLFKDKFLSFREQDNSVTSVLPVAPKKPQKPRLQFPPDTPPLGFKHPKVVTDSLW